MYSQQQIEDVVTNLKLNLDQKQDQVETFTVDEFLNGLGYLGAACEVCNIKVTYALGEVKIFESLAGYLKMHGILIITMHFPDSDQYELVTRYNEQQQKIYSFGYKL